MENIGNDIYRISIPTGASNVIFSYGSSNQTSDLAISGSGMIYENGSWSKY